MPAPVSQYWSIPGGSGAVTFGSEQVVATTRAASSPAPGTTFGIHFSCAFTIGASGTGVAFTVRRTNVTGTIVYASPTFTGAAATILPITLDALDTLPGDVASALWVVTATQPSATGNGNIAGVATVVTLPL